MRPGVLPPVYFLAALVAMAALHLALPGARILDFPWNLAGCLSLALGIVLLGSSPPLLMVLAFVFLMDRIFVRPEEKMLAERFPAAWAAYRIRVRRWL